MICKSCQAENPDAASFCFNCGTKLEAAPPKEAPCRSCQASLPLDARFCGFCGTADPLVVVQDDVAAQEDVVVHDEEAAHDEEATIVRAGLDEVERPKLTTEPVEVVAPAASASPGAYSKQGPSLRARLGLGKARTPPPLRGRKGATAGAPSPASAKPKSVGAPPEPVGARPKVGAPPKPGGVRPRVGALSKPVGAEPKPAAEPTSVAAFDVPSPGGRARVPRTLTEPQKAVYASPSPSETAGILAPLEGWPDVTDELAEIRFSSIQGIDDDTRRAVAELSEKYPDHPEVIALVVELGGDVPSAPISVEGPPPRGRYPVEAVKGGTAPPIAESTDVSPSSPDADALAGPQRPSDLVEAEGLGAPMPAAMETSDELLNLSVDVAEFDRLEDDEEPYEPSAVSLIEQLDLDAGTADAQVSPTPYAPRSSTAPTPAVSAPSEAEEDDISLEIEDVVEDEDDFVDRTMTVQGYQPAAPYDEEPAPFGEEGGSTVTDLRKLEDEDIDRGDVTLAPGGDLRGEDEFETTLPPGQYLVGGGALSSSAPDDDAAPTDLEVQPPSAPAAVDRKSTLIPDDGQRAPSPAPYSGPGGDSAAASGEFDVSDLRLDEMPDLSRASVPPIRAAELAAELAEELAEVDVEVDEEAFTIEGTVVARAPLPPSPYGRGDAPVPVVPVRLVMLGTRGEEVAERRIEAGAYLDLGRRPGEPWAEDRRMQPLHARVFPAPGGVIIDDFGAPHGVYTQILDTIAVEDGDEFKVGQARLALQRVTGPDGIWGQLTLVRHEHPTPETFRLDRDEIIIGREEGDITLPEDTFVSGDHCRFAREGNAVYLEDLGSSNGTYVRVRAGQCVAFGGLLLVGHTQFRVHAG